MKCKICGAESGKYAICYACNSKRKKGDAAHNAQYATNISTINDSGFLYNVRKTLISKSEQSFYNVIKSVVPIGYCVFPQINLASIIDRTDESRFHNELFRNVDFLITDSEYHPKFIIEINDQSHLNSERKKRDEKVQRICEEAGIPILKLWTSYGANPEYIKKRINETLQMLPVARIHHFAKTQNIEKTTTPFFDLKNLKKGCYIATCVYGSYDCPQVWTLRRYRDNTMAKTWYGRAFIRTYYAISPKLVEWLGSEKWFKDICGRILDKIISKLQSKGLESTPYNDSM